MTAADGEDDDEDELDEDDELDDRAEAGLSSVKLDSGRFGVGFNGCGLLS